MSDFNGMWDELFRGTHEYRSAEQQEETEAQEARIKAAVLEHDAYITALAAQYQCRKALILTPLVHEGLCFNLEDWGKDQAVKAYYAAHEADLLNGPPDPYSTFGDSSTGLCQIFGKTAIRAHNFALLKGLISGAPKAVNSWQDVWAMWQALQDPQYNIKMAMLVMMMEANFDMNIEPGQTRSMTPSQVMRMCVRYNTNDDAASGLVYGRNRMSQYFTVCKWEESFR